MNISTSSKAAKRVDILGVPLDLVDMERSIDHVRAMLSATGTHVILAVNPEKVIAAQRNPDLRLAIEDASLVIPDGIGVVIAAKVLYRASLQRVAGADLMPEICRLASQEGKRVFFYGAKPHVASQAASVMQRRFPQLKIVGTEHGYISKDKMKGLIHAINTSGAEILFVALGSPRQEFWISEFRKQLVGVRVCQGVGGTFDAICGDPPRAPLIFQRFYLEWLYRLVSQPQRLVRQTNLPKFIFQVFRKAVLRR